MKQANKQAYLKTSFSSIALDVLPIDDDLDNTIPHLLRHVVSSQSDQAEYRVHIPCVVDCKLLCQYGNFEYLISVICTFCGNMYEIERTLFFHTFVHNKCT